MPQNGSTAYARKVLLANGVVDLALAAMLIVLVPLGFPVPGYTAISAVEAYLAGGWGTAALSFGLGRVLASSRPEYHRLMMFLGFFEGSVLTLYNLYHLAFSRVSLSQAAMPLAVGAVFAVLYGWGLRTRAE